MSVRARTVVRCDRYSDGHQCETEFVYDGGIASARRAAVRNGWASGRNLDDMRKFADYCPEHVPARIAGKFRAEDVWG